MVEELNHRDTEAQRGMPSAWERTQRIPSVREVYPPRWEIEISAASSMPWDGFEVAHVSRRADKEIKQNKAKTHPVQPWQRLQTLTVVEVKISVIFCGFCES